MPSRVAQTGGVETDIEAEMVDIVDDPYQTLGVARDASAKDIRAAYRKLAKQHHPDLNPGSKTSEERFKAISVANELLSDVEKRAKFDRGEIDGAGQEKAPRPSYREYADAEGGRRYTGARGESFNDIFGAMFDDGHHPSGPRRGRDEHYTLATEFLDAVIGATRRLVLPDGRSLDVKIPAGTRDGQILRLRGQGQSGGAEGNNGDALIEIHVKPHGFFQRHGQDIDLELPVSLHEATLGGMVEIPTPGGAVRMRVPPQSDSGTKLRLRGRGVPAHGTLPAGDLHATLRVVLGTPDPALEEFLRGWTPENPANPRTAMEAKS